MAGWIEFLLLRRGLNHKIGHAGVPSLMMVKLWLSAGIAALVACLLEHSLPPLGPILLASLVLGGYGATYFGLAYLMRVPECVALLGRFLRVR